MTATRVFASYIDIHPETEEDVAVEVSASYSTGEQDVGLMDGWVDHDASIDGETIEDSWVDYGKADEALDLVRAEALAYWGGP